MRTAQSACTIEVAMYEWDEAKRASNRAKHQVDFTAIERFEWGTAIAEFDDRHAEPRWTARGFIGDVLYSVVFTELGHNIRIISLRKATGQEARGYVDRQT